MKPKTIAILFAAIFVSACAKNEQITHNQISLAQSIREFNALKEINNSTLLSRILTPLNIGSQRMLWIFSKISIPNRLNPK